MNTVWNFGAPFLALVGALAAMQLSVALAGAFRSRDYRRFENRSAEKIGKEFPLPDIASSAAGERRKTLAPLLGQMHQAANRAQTAYHDTVVRSAACLALGFAATAAGMLGPQDWPSSLRFPFAHWPLLLNWIDAEALLFVFVLFLRGNALYRPWINKRARTELVRQYQYLSVLFPAEFLATTEPRLCAGQLGECEQKDQHLGRTIGQIEKTWRERRSRIEHFASGQSHLDRDAVILYLQKRVLRQLGWFTDSIARLEHIAARRKTALLVLYVVTASLAILQLLCFLTGTPLPIVRPVLLLITGLSLALTAYYTNQNLRSIVHRYNVQQRDIRRWLRDLVMRLDDRNLPHFLDDPATIKSVSTLVSAFEELMIYEMIDWINISGHDVIELG